MCARAAIKTGVLAGVYIGANKVLGMSEYSASGKAAKFIEANEFGYAVDKKVPDGTIDPGTISVPNVLADPADLTGQALLDAACTSGTGYGPNAIKFMRDATSYYTVDTGGLIYVSRVGGANAKRNGLETTSYEFQISAAELVLKPSLVSIAVTGGGLSVVEGATQQMTATGTYSDSSTADLTASVIWSSATLADAVVTASGLAVGLSAGSSVISATLLGIVGSATLTVTAS